MIEAVIAQFGSSIEIDALSLNDEGVVQLSFNNIGDLYIEKIKEDVLIYLLKSVEFTSVKLFWNALSLCHSQDSYPFQVNPIFTKDNQIGFSIRHTDNTFTLPSINQSIEFLSSLHQKLFNIT